MSNYCWNVSRPSKRGLLSVSYVAMGRQGSLNKAKAAARKNHEEDCVTTVWEQVLRVEGAPPAPVHEYVNGRWRIRR